MCWLLSTEPIVYTDYRDFYCMCDTTHFPPFGIGCIGETCHRPDRTTVNRETVRRLRLTLQTPDRRTAVLTAVLTASLESDRLADCCVPSPGWQSTVVCALSTGVKFVTGWGCARWAGAMPMAAGFNAN
jgi:hypothetical protein